MDSQVAMLDFKVQLDSLQDSLNGKFLVQREGKTVAEFDSPLTRDTVHALMTLLRATLSQNTTLSLYTPAYVMQVGHSMNCAVNRILRKEMYNKRITFEQKEVLLCAIDQAVMSALLRGLGGIERQEYIRSTQTNYTISSGGGGTQPTRV